MHTFQSNPIKMIVGLMYQQIVCIILYVAAIAVSRLFLLNWESFVLKDKISVVSAEWASSPGWLFTGVTSYITTGGDCRGPSFTLTW